MAVVATAKNCNLLVENLHLPPNVGPQYTKRCGIVTFGGEYIFYKKLTRLRKGVMTSRAARRILRTKDIEKACSNWEKEEKYLANPQVTKHNKRNMFVGQALCLHF